MRWGREFERAATSACEAIACYLDALRTGGGEGKLTVDEMDAPLGVVLLEVHVPGEHRPDHSGVLID